jgi:hypothetical protein
MLPLMPTLPKAAWYSFHIRRGIPCDDDGDLWEPENPNYDPGPLPLPMPPTEAQLQRKRRQAEARAAQQAWLCDVGSWIPPIFESVSPASNIHPVENRTCSPQATPSSVPASIPSTFTMKQVSDYHQATGRDNQDQLLQSTLANRSGYHRHVNLAPQFRSFGTGNRRGNTSNSLLDTRPSTTHFRGDP